MSRLEPPFALEISELRKSFDRPAVDGLNLTVRLGEIYALLGPNGAGKTTALRMVAGLLPPDAGAISILGIDALRNPVAAKKVTAWISDEPMIYDKLTPFEYLEFVAGLWGVDAGAAEQRARDLLGWLGLGNHAHERCERFSKGMRQKVALAGALVHEPRLIILPAPFGCCQTVASEILRGYAGDAEIPALSMLLIFLTVRGEAANAVSEMIERAVVQGPGLQLALSAAARLGSVLSLDALRQLLDTPSRASGLMRVAVPVHTRRSRGRPSDQAGGRAADRSHGQGKPRLGL